jgi:hypothetical protein
MFLQKCRSDNNERDYGLEAVELLQVMENQREDLIIIFAGGKDKIDGFFNSNPEFLHVLETM